MNGGERKGTYSSAFLEFPAIHLEFATVIAFGNQATLLAPLKVQFPHFVAGVDRSLR